MYQSGRAGDEAKKRKSQTRQKRRRVGITVIATLSIFNLECTNQGCQLPTSSNIENEG